MESSGCVNNYHIGATGDPALDGVESDGSGVGAHALFHDRYAYPLAPDRQLINGSSPESVRSPQQDGLAGFFEVIGQFTDGSRFAYAVHSYDQDHMGFMTGRRDEVAIGLFGSINDNSFYFFLKYPVQFTCIQVLILSHSFFYLFDYPYGRIDSHIGAYQGIFQVIQDFFVHGAFAGNGFGETGKKSFLGLLQSLV